MKGGPNESNMLLSDSFLSPRDCSIVVAHPSGESRNHSLHYSRRRRKIPRLGAGIVNEIKKNQGTRSSSRHPKDPRRNEWLNEMWVRSGNGEYVPRPRITDGITRDREREREREGTSLTKIIRGTTPCAAILICSTFSLQIR